VPKVTYRSSLGTSTDVDVDAGESVMFGAIQNGVAGITAECGGVLSCATCHVYVDQAWAERVGPPSEDERDMLEAVAAEQRETSRLSCQITVTEELDGLIVDLPLEQ